MTVQFYLKGGKTPMPREFKPISGEYSDKYQRRLLRVIPKNETTHDLDPETVEIVEREAVYNPKENCWEIRFRS